MDRLRKIGYATYVSQRVDFLKEQVGIMDKIKLP